RPSAPDEAWATGRSTGSGSRSLPPVPPLEFGGGFLLLRPDFRADRGHRPVEGIRAVTREDQAGLARLRDPRNLGLDPIRRRGLLQPNPDRPLGWRLALA